MSVSHAQPELIASGGMGSVYRVVDPETGQALALKRVRADLARVPHIVESFEREYRVLASLSHPRIIRVYDYGHDASGPYYTMELLEGDDLYAVAPLTVRQACSYLRDIATSLALLHSRRLVHRDLSPSNVRMAGDGHCKLIDFGTLANFGPSETLIGTPPFIAPETLRGGYIDSGTDLFALGALGYWMLTGRYAFAASSLDDLEPLWAMPPLPPSALNPDVPPELDELILSLMSVNPLSRPVSAGEVIARLTVIGGLEPEHAADAALIARSFLANPRFVGRVDELELLTRLVRLARDRRAQTALIRSIPGMGRTRLLQEVDLAARLEGALVLHVDASVHQETRGVIRALLLRSMDQAPTVVAGFRREGFGALASLGRAVKTRLRALGLHRDVEGATDGGGVPDLDDVIERWFEDLSKARVLVLLVDNAEYADDASLALLSELGDPEASRRIVVVAAARHADEEEVSRGLRTLGRAAKVVSLHGLELGETRDLARTLFGEVPHLERFAVWLHEQSAGSPLHQIELSKQLLASGDIQHIDGVWVLPVDPPDAAVSAGLGEALAVRFRALSPGARRLAETLSVHHRERPTLELCRLLVQDGDSAAELLDELERNGIFRSAVDGYQFTSIALRDALRHSVDEVSQRQHHGRLGEALSRLPGASPAVLVEAGWHFIQGGQDARGASLIEATIRDSSVAVTLAADMPRPGTAFDAALKVYKRERRSMNARLPLLAALAYAGYYEDKRWGDLYGDEALDALEEATGLQTARRLRPYLGAFLSLTFGVLLALLRFRLGNRAEGFPTFLSVLQALFRTVTVACGAAAVQLDARRASAVAGVLAPFAVMPSWTTPAGMHQFCTAIAKLGREEEVALSVELDSLLSRLDDPKCFPSMPDAYRVQVRAAALFPKGVLSVLRIDGSAALECADALDGVGLTYYALIASELRYLYYLNRGEHQIAAVHRRRVERHVARFGSAWQVEAWEGAAALLTLVSLSDVVALRHQVHRLESAAKTAPSLELYLRLARQALALASGELRVDDAEAAAMPPRSFMGWAAAHGFAARAENERGEHALAKARCEAVLAHVEEADLDFVSLFLPIHLAMAHAEAGLGDVDAALARLDGLLARYRASPHPLAHGLLHEARATICFRAGRRADYEAGVLAVESWFRPTGTPALVARCDRLAALATNAGRPLSKTEAALQEAIPTAPGVDDFRLSRSAVTEPRDLRTGVSVRAAARRVSSWGSR